LRDKATKFFNALIAVAETAWALRGLIGTLVVVALVMGALNKIYQASIIIGGIWTAVQTAMGVASVAAGTATVIAWFPIILIVLAIIAAVSALIVFFNKLNGKKVKLSIGTEMDDLKNLSKTYGGNIDSNATGTNYFRGGRTVVGEYGPELVTLPGGSKINTASQTKSLMSNGSNVNINVYVDGAKKSDEETADAVAKRILEVLDNT
jgi:hypothetical protein